MSRIVPITRERSASGDFRLCFDRYFFNFFMACHASDGDHAAYVGSDGVIRDALVPRVIGRAATEAAREEAEDSHGPGCIDNILEHYAPFMPDDD